MAVVHIAHRHKHIVLQAFPLADETGVHPALEMCFSVSVPTLTGRKSNFVYPSCLYATPMPLQVLNLFILQFERKRVSRQKNGLLASCHCQSNAACSLCHGAAVRYMLFRLYGGC